MKNERIHPTTVRLDNVTYNLLKSISEKNDTSLADTLRITIKKGLERDYVDNSADLIANIVHREMEVVLKTHTNRLASLTSKTGHAAVASMFLNVQAIMDFVPPERRKEAKDMYEKAMKKAVVYMKTPLVDLTKDYLDEE